MGKLWGKNGKALEGMGNMWEFFLQTQLSRE
jgi:hypothetical protein